MRIEKITITVPIKWNIVKVSSNKIKEKNAEIIGVNEMIMAAFPISIYVNVLYHTYKESP